MKKKIYDYFWVLGSVLSLIMFVLIGIHETVFRYYGLENTAPPAVHFLVYHIYCQLMVKRVF